MSGHTPGPWHVEPSMDGGIEPDVKAGEWFIATVNDCADSRSPEANARLIAAAPELLAALSEMLDRYVELVAPVDAGLWDAETEPQVIAARAAIAKATGETA